MRGCAALLVAVPVLTACGSSPAASASPSTGTSSPSAPDTPAGHAARCGPAHAPTLAASTGGRVYVSGGVAYGCSPGVHKRYRLGGRRFCNLGPRLGPVTVAGRLAAYGLESCGIDTATAEVAVRQLTDGKTLLSAPAIAHVPGPESFQTVKSIVAKQDGAVAWISSVSSLLAHRAFTEVHRADAHGQALLDSGAAIAPRSLSLHGSTVTWRHGSATRSATLR